MKQEGDTDRETFKMKDFQKIVHPKHTNEHTDRLRSNKRRIRRYVLTEGNEDLIKVYGHTKPWNRLDNPEEFFEFQENRVQAKTEIVTWISTTKEDVDVAGMKQEDNTDRKTFRH